MPLNFLNNGIFPDNAQLSFGTSGDLVIKHDGSNSKLENNTGDLYIINEANNEDIIFQNDDGSGGIETYFYLDGSLADGTYNYTRWNDGGVITFGDGQDLRIWHDPSNSSAYMRNYTNDLYIESTADDKDIIFKCDDGSGGTATYFFLDGSEVRTTFNKEARFIDDAKLKLGDSGDLEIYHSGSHSFISDQGTGDLVILSNQVSINNAANSENIAKFIENGAVELYYDDSKKFETTTNGVTITGGLTTTASSTIAGANATADFLFLDDVKASFGTSGDLEIYHDASNSYIKDTATGSLRIATDHFRLYNAAVDELMITAVEDGAVDLYYNYSKKFETTNAGATVTGDLTVSGAIIPGSLSGYLPLSGGTMTGDIVFNDSVKARFGTGLDAYIQHDGTNTEIINATGNLNIKSTATDGDISFYADDGSGGVEEYFRLDGSAGSSDPVTVFPDSSYLKFGSSQDFSFVHNGSQSYIQNFTGDLQIQNNADDADILFRCDDGSGGLTTYFYLDGSIVENRFSKATRHSDNIIAKFGDGNDLNIYSDGTNGIISNVNGSLNIIQNTDDEDINIECDNGSGGTTTYMLFDGSQTNIHTQVDFRIYDDKKLQLGNDADFEAFHDGTHMYMANNTGDWYITQAADNEDIIFRGDDGSGGAATYFYMDGSLVNGTSVKGATRFPDSSKIYMGTGGDLEIFHDGTDTYLENYTGSFNFTQHLNDGNMVFKCDDGSGGTAVYFTLDGGSSATNELYTKWPDYSRIALGTGKDLQLYHDGSNSFIQDIGTGNLYIDATSSIIFRDYGSAEEMAKFINDGAVELYYDNSKKFETTTTGIEVTGLTDTDSLLIGSGATVTTILDEDNMASDSATALATQQSIKAYVDSSTTGVLTYQGTWNADTNSPTLSSGSGTPGYYYIVSTAGSTNLDGITDWAVGDWAVFSDQATDAWQKIDNTAVGNVSGSGANNRLVLWNGTSTVDSDSNFYMSGTTLYAPNLTIGGNLNATSNLTVDCVGDITLDAGGNDIRFSGDGTQFGKFTRDGGNFRIYASEDNKDLEFWGVDDSSDVLALTLDMSEAGYAIFNSGIQATNTYFTGTMNVASPIYHVGDTDTYFGFSANDTFSVTTGGTTALTIDSSQDATFAGDIAVGPKSNATVQVSESGNSTVKMLAGSVGRVGTYSSHNLNLMANSNTVLTLDTSQDALFASDVAITAKLAVGATSAHASYDLYNQGTFYSNGAATINANLTVDAGSISITADGSNAVTLTESGSGDFTIDAPDDIRLDAGGGDIALRDDGIEYGRITNNNPGLKISSSATDSSINLMPNGSGNVYAYTDSVIIAGDEAETTQLMFRTDQGDDNGDDWIIKNPLDNILEFTNNISGSQVEHFSITPAATVADSIATFAGKVLIPSGYVGRDTHNYITFETDDQIVIRVADSHRLKLTSAAMLPYTDSSYDLGSTALRYSNIWVDNINGGTPTTGGPYLPLSGGTVSGNVAVTGTTTVGSSTGNGAVLHGSKAVTLTENTFTTTLTVTLSGHTACYVKIFVTGDWNSHSAVQYLGEYFLANSDGSYNEPGMIIREVDNTKTDSIVGKIVDPSGTSGNRDFVIQLKADDTVGSNNVAAKVTYEVMGQYVSVS